MKLVVMKEIYLRCFNMKLSLCLIILSSFCYSQVPVENTAHQIQIKWVAPKNQAFDGFHIYRADTCHDFVYLKNVGQVRQYTDKAVIGAEVYRYKVRTVLNGVESIDSNVPSATVPLL